MTEPEIEPEIDDSLWRISLKEAMEEPFQVSPLVKKALVTICMVRSAYDSRLMPISAIFIQDVEFEVPDIEEFQPYYLRVINPRIRRKKFDKGHILFINLENGSTQPITFDKDKLRKDLHITMKPKGEETKIDMKTFRKMKQNGEIFAIIQGTLEKYRIQVF